ncbi:MAG: DUF2937 family protein [Neisseria sp.]|nr:DUF2937 family protein [Neisseria sp.]
MLSHYVRMVIFALLLLIGLQVPAFVDQYGKALQAHWSESERAVSGFRADAQKFFAGDMERLLQHYLQQTDPVIRQGGENVRTLVTRNRVLSDAVADFRSSPWRAYAHTFFYPVADVRDEVWQSYGLIAPLNMASVAFGFGFALFWSVLLDAVTAGVKRLTRRRVQAA